MQWLIILLFAIPLLTQPTTKVCVNRDAYQLFEKLNSARAKSGLSKIPLSSSLCKVAQAHANDLDKYANTYPEKCNIHSWSEHGNWTACCYTDDHAKSACMWQKPLEIAEYPSNGYEISFYMDDPTAASLDIEVALNGWINSKFHRPVIFNEQIWAKMNWRAIGVGVGKNYAVVWFGTLADPQGTPERCN